MAILPVTVGRIDELTRDLSPAEARRRPDPDSWSINDVLAHLRACHDVLGGNMLRIVAEDRPTWRAMNPRTWINHTDYPEWEFAAALAAFTDQRARLLATLEELTPDAWRRTANETGLPGGPIERDVRYYGSWMAGHERAHTAHIGRIAAVVRASREGATGSARVSP